MPRLLVVHHTPSPPTHTLLEAVVAGAGADGLDHVDVVTKAALHTTAVDVLTADGYVLGTPANLGSMSGALKHFFDTIYYPCLEDTVKRPFGIYVHGNNDTDGALRDIAKVVTGLRWTQVAEPVQVVGAPDRAATDACWNLGATVAASLTP